MKKILLSLLACLAVIGAVAQQTYRNPVINADAPDVSVCKVADTYYMISTTMHLMPGAPIMKSKDMVNWEIASYVFDRIDDGDRYNLIDGQTVYGQGQWASSLRYHMGKFYVWFTANGAPGKGFVFEADQAEGPWRLVARPPHMHDASLFFDEDGKRYLFTGSGSCTVVELDENFQPKEGGINAKVVDSANDPEEKGALLEGSSVIKHNGKYYICMISMKWGAPGRVRREVCYRSDNITGPYEKKVILETPFESYGGVGQGCLVGDDQSDEGWWALIFQDRGGIGRVPCTLPVTWVEGWPMVGEFTGKINPDIAESPGDNPTGNIRLDKRAYRTPSDYSKPHPSVKGFIGSDEFDQLPVDPNGGYHARNGMSLYWQWNHNPIDEAWSLTERPGYMRLKTARVVDNLQVAPNTLTQRMSGPLCSGAVKIDVSSMKDGDVCGLAAFNGDSGVLRIVKKGGKYVLQLVEEKGVFKQPRNVDHVDVDVIAEVNLNLKKTPEGKCVYLKINGDFNPGRDKATFAYSLNGEDWKTIGHELPMTFDYMRHFMGTKFAVFNYATKSLGGHVDVDWFHFTEGADNLAQAKGLPQLPPMPDVADPLPKNMVRVGDSNAFEEVQLDIPITEGPFQANWESIESNYPGEPDWLRDAKFGIWVHFGPQSAGESGDWYARKMYSETEWAYKNHVKRFGHPSEVGYKEVLRDWNPTALDPEYLTALYQKAGARFLMIQGVHHDNYDLWNSQYQPWNSVNVGPKRDLLREWSDACHKHNMRYGVTFHHEYTWWWWQTAFQSDKTGPLAGVPYDGNLTLADGVGKWWEGLDPRMLYGVNLCEYETVADRANSGWAPAKEGIFWRHLDYAKWYATQWALRMMDVTANYDPDFIYTDGTVQGPFTGNGTGTGYKCNAMPIVMADYYNRQLKDRGKVDGFSIIKFRRPTNGAVNTAEFDFPDSINNSQPWIREAPVGDWFYGPNFTYDSGSVIRFIIEAICRDGNVAVNIPMRPDGSIEDNCVTMLEEIGDWMNVNGRAVYGSKAWTTLGEGEIVDGKLKKLPGGAIGRTQADFKFTPQDIRFTVGKDGNLYAFCLDVPEPGQKINIKSVHPDAKKVKHVSMLGSSSKLKWSQTPDGLEITCPEQLPCKSSVVFCIK